jgi:23S rRNA (guanosine2251-2'-O)-methyltransferase
VERKNHDSNPNFIFGIHPVIEALKSEKDVEKVFIQKGISPSIFKELRGLMGKREIPFQFVPQEKLNRRTSKTHQGVIAFVTDIKFQEIENILPVLFEKGKVPLLLVLDRITDVRNFGAICRTAECCGVDAVIVPSRGAAQINSDSIKTSAGALHKIAVCRSQNLKTTLAYLSESGLKIVACTEKTEMIYTGLDYTQPIAIIMGSEDEGISGEYLKLSDARAKIPLLGEIGSLNVSVACGVILYEVIRQRMN